MSLPRGFREWLRKESTLWQDQGLLQPGQRERILALYPEPANDSGALAFALRTLGVLLFGAAIFLVISHNWADFSRPGRLGTVFAALAVIQGIGLGCFVYGRHRSAVIAHLLGCLMYGAGIALIGQIYHLDAHAPDAVLAWCIFTIPFALLLDATVLHLLVIALAGSWLMMEASCSGSHCAKKMLLHRERFIFAALLAPTAVAAYRRARPALTGALAWSFVFLWCLFLGHTPVHLFALPLVLAALHPTGDARARGFRFIGAASVTFISISLGGLNEFRSFGDSFLRQDLLFTLGTAALALWAIRRARARGDSHAAWMGLVALLTLAIGLLGSLGHGRTDVKVLVTAIANVTSLLLAVALIRQGLAENRLRPYAYGAAVFLVWLFVRYVDISKDMGYLGMAGIFLLIGGLLFALAKVWRQPREPGIVEAMPDFRAAFLERLLTRVAPFRRILLIGAVGLQAAVLGWMVYDHGRPVADGERHLLLCEPVDPRDLLRGDYVILRYGFQSLRKDQYQALMREWKADHPADAKTIEELEGASGHTELTASRAFDQVIPKDVEMFLPLTKGADGLSILGDPTFREPRSGSYLRARNGRSNWGIGDLRAGIESFYVAEGTGQKWEKLRNQGRLLAEIGVLPDGRAGLVALKEAPQSLAVATVYRPLERFFYQAKDFKSLRGEIFTDKASFDRAYHPAPLNGRNAVTPDFARECVVSVVDQETDLATEISVVSAEKIADLLTVTVKVVRGEKQTYRMRPQIAIIVPKEGLRGIEIRTTDRRILRQVLED
jgi:uncharacterized membrane protein/uncharacterized membrane-anchored protein